VLEFRSAKLGFAVFEAAQLLDFGVTVLSQETAASERAADKIMFLVSLYTPSLVIARTARRAKEPSSDRAAIIMRNAKRAIKRRGLPFMVLKRAEIRRFYAAAGCSSKSDTATWLLALYPELGWKEPPRRKPWQREGYWVPAFDAVATAVAFDGGDAGAP
jgi:hypothetical protein